MWRRWFVIVAASVAVVVAMVAVVIAQLDHNKQGRPAIDEVSHRLDLQFTTNTPVGVPSLVFPDTLQESDFYGYLRAYQETFSNFWMSTLKRQGLEVGWPGDMQLLSHAKGDGPSQHATACAPLNLGQSTVGPDSGSMFYCVHDAMRVPDILPYPQGTLWLPIAALLAQWQRPYLAASTLRKGEQLGQTAFVYITALWADALSRQIRAYANQVWHMHLPLFEEHNLATTFGYCVAGAMGRAVFPGQNVVPEAVRITYGPQADPPLADWATALSAGYNKGTLGGCVRAYWPQTDQGE